MDRLRKYKVGDLVECVAITPWNVEKLCLGAYYSVEGSTFLVDDVVYSVKSIETDKIYYSIDRFERVGEVVRHADGHEEEYPNAPEELDIISETIPTHPDSTFARVNHPKHYNSYGGFEVIDVIEQVTEHLKGIECVCIGNVIKYVLRYQFKNGVEDLKKARFYLDKVIKKLERDNNKV